MDLLARLLQESRGQEASPSLARAEALSALLNFPERSYPVIHVGGTNGKGSVCTKIAKSLEEAGYKTGLYTSPHLFAFEERMKINSVPIPAQELSRQLSFLYALVDRENIRPTFFEIATFLAFSWFAKERVDVAVIEVGLGGIFDATNVVSPLLSVITSIGIEHADRLGDTKEAIAEQKAGIIKPGIPVVLGGRARQHAIFKAAKLKDSPLFLAEPPTGRWYDWENQATARCALLFLQEDFPLLRGRRWSLAIRPPCRFEWRGGVLWDVAHNLDGFEKLIEGIALHHPGKKIRLVLGLAKDKDKEACLAFLAAHVFFFHLVQARGEKGTPASELASLLASYTTAYRVEKTVEEGARSARLGMDEREEILVVAGSFYLMQDAQKALLPACDSFVPPL